MTAVIALELLQSAPDTPRLNKPERSPFASRVICCVMMPMTASGATGSSIAATSPVRL